MHEKLSDREEKLFDLIESMPFDELSVEEQRDVLVLITEQEYRKQHALLTRTRNMSQQEISRPFILPESKKEGVLMIPWYLSLSGVAAAFLLGMWLFKSVPEKMIIEIPIATVDTVFVEKQIIDTIIQVNNDSEKRIKKRNAENDRVSSSKFPSPLVMIAAPNLSDKYIESKGVSLKNDETFALLEGLNF